MGPVDALIVSSGLFYMFMVFDMLTAITKATTLTTISEFHTRMRQVGDAAGCASMEWVLLA